MKKIRKGKKMLLTIIIAVIAIVLATVIIIKVVNKNSGKPENPDGQVQPIIALPDTTYSDMEVKNVEMEFLRDNNETMVSMEIHNTTKNKVEKENLDVMLIGPEEKVIGQMQTYIKALEPGEQYDISVVLKGDLTATSQIKLIKKEN